jgi:hypothetical protein
MHDLYSSSRNCVVVVVDVVHLLLPPDMPISLRRMGFWSFLTQIQIYCPMG